MERDLTQHENLDAIDREKWSIAASEALIQSVDTHTLGVIVAHGFDEYLRVTRTVYQGHAFRFEDYQRMFERLKRALAQRLGHATVKPRRRA